MSAPPARADSTEAAVIWHDAECGGYDVDLALWERLAERADDRVLELGSGTGRVTLHLAARGHTVVGVEHDSALAMAARERATARGLSVQIVEQEIEGLELELRFDLIIAPMQVIQLLDGPGARIRAMRAAAAHLTPAGTLAVAIVEGASDDIVGAGTDAVPDVREHDGWVFSSLPIEVAARGRNLVVRRLRQVVAPSGELSESIDVTALCIVDREQLEAEAARAGLRVAGRTEIAATDLHVGSTVLLFEHGRQG